ncbi:hypothetical protein C8R43DRAFT_120933 [Mycena crocata]|nr:hypothetical protein C8R43DRAFT_120933 [Mycena crocata]
MARDRPVRPSSSKHAANAGRKTFTRSERALCRFLAHEHSIPAGEIHVATGWSEQSIYNVLRGKHPYTNTDADDDKKHLPQDADTILLKIRNRQIRERMSDLQKDTRQWQLMPSERALCHFLAHEHSVPVAEVHVETGWSVPTIQNVLKGTGSYTKFNPDDDKKHLPSDADAILDKIRTRMADTLHLHAKTMPPPTRALCRFLAAEHVVVGEIRYATGWPVSAIQNVLRGTGNYTYIIANDDKKHLPPDAGAILLKVSVCLIEICIDI